MCAQLIYYGDDNPGIARLRRGRGFSYRAPDGTTIDNSEERARLEAMAVPPAYDEVWMSPLENSHLQATGRDAKARKQYRYHALWSEAQSRNKFDVLPEFGALLPRLRRRMRRDLDAETGSRTFALASALLLLDRLAMRVGNERYAKENGSFGALTLRRRHMSVKDGAIRLDYLAKGGKRVRRQISDRTLSRILHEVADLPGLTLLSWEDDGKPAALTSGELNDYIKDVSDDDRMTAKTFRTWTGTVAAFEVAEKGGATIKAMSEAAAHRLRNTPTIARNSYIHPDVIGLADAEPDLPIADPISDLRAAEARLLAFLG